MQDNINVERLAKQFGLSGHVTVELFDNLTGKLKHREEGHNFIGLGLYERMKWALKNGLTASCPNNSITKTLTIKTDASPQNGFFTGVVLTTDNSPESPTTETMWKGDLVGWGGNSAYTGSNLKGGTIDTALCCASDNFVRWVWEFAADRANGTFQSINLVDPVPTTESSEELYRVTPILPDYEFVTMFLARNYTYITEGGGYYWGTYGQLLFKIDKSTMQEIAQYTLQGNPNKPILYDDGYIYYYAGATHSYKIARYHIATSTTELSYAGCYVDSTMSMYNGYIYFYASSYIQRQLISGFTTDSPEPSSISSSVFNNSYWNSMFIYNGVLYAPGRKVSEYGGATLIWKFDWDTSTWSTAGFSWCATNTPLQNVNNHPHVIYGPRNGPTSTGKNMLLKQINMTKYYGGSLFTRKLLASPVTKTTSDKLRITYQINFD